MGTVWGGGVTAWGSRGLRVLGLAGAGAEDLEGLGFQGPAGGFFGCSRV